MGFLDNFNSLQKKKKEQPKQNILTQGVKTAPNFAALNMSAQSSAANQSTPQGPRVATAPTFQPKPIAPAPAPQSSFKSSFPVKPQANIKEDMPISFVKDVIQPQARLYAAAGASVFGQPNVNPTDPASQALFGTNKPFNLGQQQPFVSPESKLAAPLAAAFIAPDAIPGFGGGAKRLAAGLVNKVDKITAAARTSPVIFEKIGLALRAIDPSKPLAAQMNAWDNMRPLLQEMDLIDASPDDAVAVLNRVMQSDRGQTIARVSSPKSPQAALPQSPKAPYIQSPTTGRMQGSWTGTKSSKPSTADATSISRKPNERGDVSGLSTDTSVPFETQINIGDTVTYQGQKYQITAQKGVTGDKWLLNNQKLVSKSDVTKTSPDEAVLDSLNPTGGVLVDYTPETRASMKLGKNITTLDKTMASAPDRTVTIYRGAPKNQKDIAPGDFVTTNYDLAKSYGSNILRKEVKASDVLDDITEPLGEEYIYRPGGTPTGDRPFPARSSEAGFIRNPFARKSQQQADTALQSAPQPEQLPASPRRADLTPQQSLSLSNDVNELKRAPELNLSKLAISSKGKELIKETAEEIRPRLSQLIGKPLSNAETIRNVQASAQTFKQAVGREQTEEWTAKLLRTREKFADMAETGVVDREFMQTLVALRTIASDAGRKLQSFSIEAKPAQVTLKQYMMENMLDLGHNIDDLLKEAEGVDFNNYKEAAAFYRKFVKPKASEWVDLLRYNSMLTSPLTHIVNIASNLVNSVTFAPLEKLAVGAIDFIGAAATGKQQERFAGEGGQFLKGYFENIGEATKRFGKSLKGDVPTTNLDTRQIPLTQDGTAANKVEKALSTPLKFLEATDQFFTALTEGGERAALNYRKSKGVKVDDFEEKVTTAALYRLYREEPGREGQGHILDAIDTVTGLLQKARTAKNPIVSTIAKFTFPFVRTPMNIFKQGIEYSPLGVFNLYGADDKTEVLARAAIGSSIAAAAATLLASGRMTWAEPSNEAEKNAFKAAGKQPYSVKIGNEWVSFQKLPPPLAFPMSMIAAINDAIETKKMDESTGQLILHAVAKYGSFLSDQSYAKSMGDLVSAFQGEESSMAKLASNYPQQLIPYRALGGWLARITDHVQRKPDPDGTYIEKQVQYLMMNIPGLSDNVPARTDSEGKEIKANNPIINAFSPVRISTENTEKAAEYQGILDIKKMEQEATARNNLLKDEAEDIVASLGAKSKGQQKRELIKLKRSNPALAEKVQDLLDMETEDYTAYEKKLKNASVETRAQMLQKQLKGMDKKDQRILLNEYKKKKIVSDAVSERLRELQREAR